MRSFAYFWAGGERLCPWAVGGVAPPPWQRMPDWR
jgi:hypothetical protein